MPIVSTSYVKSKNLYALDLNTFEIRKREAVYNGTVLGYSFWATVDAIWTKTTKGHTSVTKGSLHHSFPQYRNEAGQPDFPAEEASLEGFMDHFDSRYGGQPEARWDGEILWTPAPTPLKAMVDFAGDLDPILQSVPHVPPGFTGWYLLT